MSDIAIRVENLGKKFIIGQKKESDLRNAFKSGLKKFLKPTLNAKQEFMALDDVSFEVNKGDAVGIIGRNGAGKSTLLKILSRITEPTSGRFEIVGRVSSLLEVGTGFHMELTGRENVYLNGTILGMKRSEIKNKFDEIVTFSGVEKFIDTPVKHYSSGMKVRLAFAVAAHLEPEILIIDEVLAVGDAEFQAKCLGKMEDVTKGGRTVLFVSHNINAVTTLCSKSILLDQGKVEMFGETQPVVDQYMRGGTFNNSRIEFSNDDLSGDEFAKIHSIAIIDDHGNTLPNINIEDGFYIEIVYQVYKDSRYNPVPNVHFHTAHGEYAFLSFEPDKENKSNKLGINKSTVFIPGNLLNSGQYSISVALTSLIPLHYHCRLDNVLGFEIMEDVSKRGFNYNRGLPGTVRPLLKWEQQKID